MLGYDRAIVPFFLVVVVLLQIARFWVLVTLGRRWTIRIIAVPGEILVARGPYRFLRHPNYAVVAGEFAAVPWRSACRSMRLSSPFSMLPCWQYAYRRKIKRSLRMLVFLLRPLPVNVPTRVPIWVEQVRKALAHFDLKRQPDAFCGAISIGKGIIAWCRDANALSLAQPQQ